MIALLQRVARASVSVDGRVVGEIDAGLCVLLCAERDDDEAMGERLLERLLRYRVFADDRGRMNRSLLDRAAESEPAGLLLVPQFTLAADTRSGLRPSFTPAAAPEDARRLFEAFVDRAREAVARVASGVFGADMQVSLVNDGPVTFWLETPRRALATDSSDA